MRYPKGTGSLGLLPNKLCRRKTGAQEAGV